MNECVYVTNMNVPMSSYLYKYISKYVSVCMLNELVF